jgi:AcrR family transcriptional regulator
LETGFEAFAAKGFDGVNLVEDVLEPAGISIGSFYHQFADKTELLREVLAEAAERRRTFIVELAEVDSASDLETTVRQVVERLFDSLERDAAAWQLQRVSRIAGDDGVREFGSAARENWNGAVAHLLERWFDHPSVELRRASDPIVTLARGLVYNVLDTPTHQRRNRREQVDDMTSFVVGGLTKLLGPPRATPSGDPPATAPAP